MAAPKYKLETIEDLTKVPVERLDACLADLKRYLVWRASSGLMQTLVASGVGRFANYVWTDDDGAAGDHINLTVAETGEVLQTFKPEDLP